jgi:hypothetical protein
MSLRDLQTAFMSSVFTRDDGVIAAYLESATMPGSPRMAIYRNNIYAALSKALEAIYPVILRLVGDEFFKFAARRYIDGHPSRSGDLNRFGSDFAEFLGTFKHAASLPYLPDMARLEWCCHQAYSAADDTPLDLLKLAAVPPETYGRLRFRLNHASRLLHSAWPIDAIWRVNQADYTGDQSVDLASGGVSLLLQRRENRMALMTLSAAEWQFLSALNDRQTLEVAYERAMRADPAADFGALLHTHVGQATLVEFFL